LLLLPLALKALTTAAIVVAAAYVAERTRPFLAAMVLSLPVSAGPAYVMLALDQPPDFIAQAALASIVTNASIVPGVLAYAWLANRGASMPVSLAGLLGGWFALALVTRHVEWTLTTALLLNAVCFAIGMVASRHWLHAPSLARPASRWFDIPIRAALVVTLVILVVSISSSIGPAATGLLALLPVAYSSFIILMHRRLGGPAIAAALCNGLIMLVGFIGFLVGIQVFASRGQVWLGIAVGLATPIVWSLIVLGFSRFRAS
jgi:hypothetical protein